MCGSHLFQRLGGAISLLNIFRFLFVTLDVVYKMTASLFVLDRFVVRLHKVNRVGPPLLLYEKRVLDRWPECL